MAQYETKEEVLKLGEMDPELAAFIKANPLPPVDYSDIEFFKAASEQRLQMTLKALGTPPPEVIQTPISYTTRDGHTNRGILYQPSSPPSSGSPLIVMYHGGGFCIGVPEGEEQTCRNLVLSYGAVCLSLAYRLAPEHPFPASTNDSWDALQWAAANASTFKADPSLGFIIGGTSAGGNIAAVLAHKARDTNLTPPLTGHYLAIPALCPDGYLPLKYQPMSFSHTQNKNAPVLPRAAIDMFMASYAPSNTDTENYAVFNHPRGHGGLPPVYIQVDGLDPLRDEALIYERVLRTECGVKTKMDVYPGLPHGHWSFFPQLESSRKFRREQVEGFGWLLGIERKVDERVEEAKVSAV